MHKHFSPSTITEFSAHAVIANAYRAAGIEPPHDDDTVDKLLAAEQTPSEIAAHYATQLIDGGIKDIPAHLEKGYTAISRAAATQEFARIYNAIATSADQTRLTPLRETAATQLQAPFQKLVARLTKAAKALDQKRPLDRSLAIDQGTGEHILEAERCLTTLSHYVYQACPDLGEPELAALLPIIQIADAPVEQYYRGHLNHESIQDDWTQTRSQTRALIRAARENPDHAIIQVARGTWPTISLNLATPHQLQRRIEAVQNATRREPINDDDNNQRVTA